MTLNIEGKIQLRRDTLANWALNNPVLSSGEVGFVTDQGGFKIGDGTTAWVDLGYSSGQAKSAGSAADLVSFASSAAMGSIIQYTGGNASLPAPVIIENDFVTVDLGGATLTVDSSMAWALKFAENVTGSGFRNGKIVIGRQTSTIPNHGWLQTLNANGSGLTANSEAAAVYGEGSQYCTVEGVEVEGLNGRAISFKSSSTRAIVGNTTRGNYIHSPQDNGGTAQGPANAIIFRNGSGSLLYGSHNTSEDDRVWGIDPDTFDPTDPESSFQDYTGTSSAIGDAIIQQGCHFARIVRPFVRFSGECGVDLTRGCQDGAIIDPDIRYCDKDGVFIGSGWSAVRLTSAAAPGSFTNGETFTGGTSATVGTLGPSDAFRDTTEGWLFANSTSGVNNWTVGETVTGGTSGATGVVAEIMYAAERCYVQGGRINDTLCDMNASGTGSGGSVKIQRAKDCGAVGVDLTNPEGFSVAKAGVYATAAATARNTGNVYPAKSANTYGGVIYSALAEGGATLTAFDRETIISKSADQSVTSSITLVNDTDLAIGLAGSGVYTFDLDLHYQANAAADLSWSFAAIAGATATVFNNFSSAGTTEVNFSTANTANGAGVGAGSMRNIRIFGRVIMGSTAGALQFKFAQGASDVDATTVLEGSTLRLLRVG